MDGTKYYMRAKGKISGPFDITALQKLVTRGLLTRAYEISENRTQWQAAGDFEELFPTRSRAIHHEATEAATEYEGSTHDVGDIALADTPMRASTVGASEATPLANELYYYSQGGVDVGPVTLTVLKSLVQNGTLHRQDTVWREGASVSCQACQLPQLASLFSRGRRLENNLSESGIQLENAVVDPEALTLYKKRTESGVLISGIILGALILLCLNLPWAVIGDKAYGWWTIFQADEQNDKSLLAFELLVYNAMGLALCILSPLIKGLARSITFMALGGLGVVFNLVGCLVSPTPGPAFAFFILLQVFPFCCAVIIYLAETRSVLAGSRATTSPTCIFSVILGLSSLVLLILTFMAIIDLGAVNYILIGGILLLIGLAAGIATSILGFVSLKSAYSPSINLAMRVTARCAMGMLAACIMVTILQFTNILALVGAGELRAFADHWIILGLSAARLVLLVFSTLLVALYGYKELIVTQYLRQ